MSWISVNDRLPTRNGYYKVTVKTTVPISLLNDDYNKAYFSNNYFRCESYVTVQYWEEK